MDAGQIEQVRRFNRMVTQRVGVLEDSYLRRGRPISEARLLYEIGANGAEIRGLRDRLGLDSGYVSRLLRSLERQGLVLVTSDPSDRRARLAALTAKGRAELKAYDRLSDGLARSVLSSLELPQQHRLVTAMAEVERLLRAASVEVRREAPASADGRWCIAQYFKELANRFETGFDPGKTNSASEAELTPPAGYLVIARLDGRPVACGALKIKDSAVAEIKRMWTAELARGLGIARKVLATLEGIACERRITTVRLETNKALVEAQALYRKCGYREVAAFNDEPYAHHWFEKRL